MDFCKDIVKPTKTVPDDLRTGEKCILVVEPKVASTYLASRFAAHNFAVIALKIDKDDQANYVRYTADPFRKIIDSQGTDKDVAVLTELKKSAPLVAGFTGFEGQLEYGEQILAQIFPENCNNPETSRYRYDKYWMNEALRLNGQTSIAQQSFPVTADRQELVAGTCSFYEQYHGQIVIKPRAGSGASLHVFKPESKQDIQKYFAALQPALLGEHAARDKKDLFFTFDAFLVQECVEGEEYYVDTASYGGKHVIVSIAKYKKEMIGGAFAYVYAEHLFLEEDICQKIKKYALLCLEILGMHNGLSHLEIKKSPQGLRLIEINARISGAKGFLNMMSKRRYDCDQIDAYVQLLNGEKISSPSPKSKKLQRLFFFKNMKGKFNEIDDRKITGLPCYVHHKIITAQSEAEDIADHSMFNLVMLILLESDDMHRLEADTKKLVEYEKSGGCLL